MINWYNSAAKLIQKCLNVVLASYSRLKSEKSAIGFSFQAKNQRFLKYFQMEWPPEGACGVKNKNLKKH